MFGATIVAGLGVIVTLSLWWLGFPSTPEPHADGAGPLASLNEGGGQKVAVNPAFSHATAWTYGMRLCMASGADLPVLDSVSPAKSVGTGYQFLGAAVREFVPNANHTLIYSVDNYPPPQSMVPDTLHNVQGYTVTTRCSLDPTAPYTELLIGLALVNGDGGGWQGVDVHYTVGGRSRILAIDFGVLICGRAVPSCVPPGGSPSP